MPKHLSYTLESPEVRLLTERDPTLGWLIERVGPLTQHLETDYYTTLAWAIVGQQLSDAAATTIWNRLKHALGGPLTPPRVLAADDAILRGAGLSTGKTGYLRDLATKVAAGEVDLEHIASLPDEDVVAELTSVKGIGRWTAEIFLIFSLGRPDVLAVDDGALRTTVGWLYGIDGGATRETVASMGERWRPYRTAASLYLWQGLDLRKAGVTPPREGVAE